MQSYKNNNSNQLSKTKKQQTILFVNPDPDMHEIIGMLFHSSHEYIIVNAFEAEEAIEKAKDYIGHIDLLLLDLAPPHLEGYELYKELQEDDFLKGVPVVFQTGMLRIPQEITELVTARKAEVIYTPYDKEELSAVITKLLLKFGI